MRPLLLACLLFSALPLAAKETTALVPAAFSATYTVQVDGFKVGEMERALSAAGNDTYVLETRLFTTGLVALFKRDRYVERSTWRAVEGRYEPVEFYSHYTGRNKDVVERLDFDWTRNVVTSLRDGKQTELAVEPGVVDKLMYQVVMRGELARGATRFNYRVADRSKIENYQLEVVGRERVTTVLGEMETIKVRKGTTLLWCAEELDYQPVKLEQNDDGHTIASYLTSLKRSPAVSETGAH